MESRGDCTGPLMGHRTPPEGNIPGPMLAIASFLEEFTGDPADFSGASLERERERERGRRRGRRRGGGGRRRKEKEQDRDRARMKSVQYAEYAIPDHSSSTSLPPSGVE